jgi:large subunit ribosomal protein L22
MATVKQRFIHMTARKLRRAADSIRGKEVNQALAELRVMPLRAARPLAHAVKSAQTAAKQNTSSQTYTIATIYIDEGPAMKRRILKSRGRATRMEHRMSHITVSVVPSETIAESLIKEKRHGA